MFLISVFEVGHQHGMKPRTVPLEVRGPMEKVPTIIAEAPNM